MNGDLILLGTWLLIQEVRIRHRQRPRLTFLRLKRDGSLVVVDGYDSASTERGCRIAAYGSTPEREENAERWNDDLLDSHRCTSYLKEMNSFPKT